MATNTPDTTQSDAVLGGLLGAAVAAGLVVYAALFAEAAWKFAQAEPRYTEVSRGKLGSVVELDALTQALRASPSHADLSRAAFVQMLTAQQIGLSSLRATTRLTAARRDLRIGLAIAPSDAYAWTRLAVTEQRLGNTTAAASALAAALVVAPKDRKLLPLQLDLAVVLWFRLNPEARSIIERRLAWAAQWPELKPVLAGNSAAALRARFAAARSAPD